MGIFKGESLRVQSPKMNILLSKNLNCRKMGQIQCNPSKSFYIATPPTEVTDDLHITHRNFTDGPVYTTQRLFSYILKVYIAQEHDNKL